LKISFQGWGNQAFLSFKIPAALKHPLSLSKLTIVFLSTKENVQMLQMNTLKFTILPMTFK
jgi:hypothetical protein